MQLQSAVLSFLSLVLIKSAACYLLFHDPNLYECSVYDLATGGKGVCMLKNNCSNYLENHREVIVCGYGKVCVDRDRRIDEDIRTTEETKRRREEENQKLQQYFESSRNLFVVNEKEIFDVCREESKLFGRNDEDIQLYYKKCSPYYEPSSSGLVSPSMVNPTILDEHPRMTALGWTNLDGRMAWNCGGSLIHRAFVLTAAHCMQNIGKPPDVARIGDINLSDSDSWDDKIAVDYLIEGIYVHEDYTPTYIGNLKIMLQHSFNPEGILDTCEGDSGGPLQFNANDTNRTPYDCLDGNPKVYTRVSSHLAWIEKTITENYK